MNLFWSKELHPTPHSDSAKEFGLAMPISPSNVKGSWKRPQFPAQFPGDTTWALNTAHPKTSNPNPIIPKLCRLTPGVDNLRATRLTDVVCFRHTMVPVVGREMWPQEPNVAPAFQMDRFIVFFRKISVDSLFSNGSRTNTNDIKWYKWCYLHEVANAKTLRTTVIRT